MAKLMPESIRIKFKDAGHILGSAFIVHGESEASALLAERIRYRFGWDVVIPGFGESFELNV